MFQPKKELHANRCWLRAELKMPDGSPRDKKSYLELEIDTRRTFISRPILHMLLDKAGVVYSSIRNVNPRNPPGRNTDAT